MLLHVFPTYSHLYIYIYLPGIDPITIARRCLKHNFQGFRGWKVDEVMSQLLPFDAATDQLGPFGVGSKGSANNFVFFSNRKQKRMLNSNKFSDTHGRLDSCYSRYVALKKCPWISSLSKKNTSVMMMAYYVKWCLWRIIRCRFQHKWYGLNVFCFPWFPVENDFPWFVCCFPWFQGCFLLWKQFGYDRMGVDFSLMSCKDKICRV